MDCIPSAYKLRETLPSFPYICQDAFLCSEKSNLQLWPSETNHFPEKAAPVCSLAERNEDSTILFFFFLLLFYVFIHKKDCIQAYTFMLIVLPVFFCTYPQAGPIPNPFSP